MNTLMFYVWYYLYRKILTSTDSHLFRLWTLDNSWVQQDVRFLIKAIFEVWYCFLYRNDNCLRSFVRLYCLIYDMLLKSPCYQSGSLFNLNISRRVDLGDMNYYIQKMNCYVIQIIFIWLHLIFLLLLMRLVL